MQGEGIHLAGVSLEGLDASLRRDGEGNIELQQYLAAYRKVSLLEDRKGDDP